MRPLRQNVIDRRNSIRVLYVSTSSNFNDHVTSTQITPRHRTSRHNMIIFFSTRIFIQYCRPINYNFACHVTSRQTTSRPYFFSNRIFLFVDGTRMRSNTLCAFTINLNCEKGHNTIASISQFDTVVDSFIHSLTT